MRKTIFTLVLLSILAGCSGNGGGDGVSRAALDDACLLIRQNPSYGRAFRQTERRWGVPMHVQMATMHQESKFVRNARPPYRWRLGIIPAGRASSAFGYAQALDGTWKDYQKDTGKRFARRNNIGDAADFMGWYMNKSRDRNGIALTDTRNQYLAYHEGHTGYARGSYRRKGWLMRVAAKVEGRADLYDAQLATCSHAR